MGRGSRGGTHGPRRVADLTGIISVAERTELVNLINTITEKMLRDINSLFDSPPIDSHSTSENADSLVNCLSLALHNYNCRQQQQVNIKLQSSRSSFDPKSRGSKIVHNIAAVEEKKSISPQLIELKKEAVAFFKKWQGNVLQKFRDINVAAEPPVNSAPSTVKASRGIARGRSSGRGIRGGGGGGSSRGGGLTATLVSGPPCVPSNHTDLYLARHYSPTANALWTMPQSKRKLYLHLTLLSLLSLNEHTAYAHTMMLHLASSLNLPLSVYRTDEERIAKGIAQAASQVSVEQATAQKEENKTSKKWKFNLGASLSPVAKLAPPLAAVGIGTTQGGCGLTPAAAAGLLGSMSDNGLLMGSIFGLNPSKPLDKMVEGFSREVPDFAFLVHSAGQQNVVEYADPRQTLASQRRLRLVIAMSGFILEDADISAPWTYFGDHVELYSIKWELCSLKSLGTSLETVIKSIAWKSAKETIAVKTIFASLMNADWPLGLLKISKIVDNPWSMGMVRAEKAGAILADAIMRHKFQGERPVSLVGYSLAARAIYVCLMILAERRHFGMIESVVLMGTPAPSESKVWLTLKSVVSGRLVNVYSEQDYILGFLYRTSNIQYGIAGLQDIQGVDGVENYRVPKLEQGHLSYQRLTSQILRSIGWEACSN